MLVLSADDQRSILSIQGAMTAVASALAAESSGKTITPIRTHVPFGDNASMLVMPSLVNTSPATLGVKLVCVAPRNPELGKRTTTGVLILADVQTGESLALLEASYLTALRTGAVTGVATSYLARGDASVLAVIGTGAQARTCVEAICAIRPITEIRLYNRTPEKAALFAQDIASNPNLAQCKVHVFESTDQAVVNADIVVTATNSQQPVFSSEALRSQTHVNAIGSYRPDMQEIPSEVFHRNPKVVVESVAAALEETGDLLIPMRQQVWSSDSLYAELGQIVLGNKEGRTDRDDLTVFKSVGLAAMDMTVAQVMYEQALSQGRGQTIQL